MTDPGAEMKARAQKAYVDWVDDDDDGRSYWEIMAAFAAKEVARAVEEERESCAKLICEDCAKARKREGGIHLVRGLVIDCAARKIHERSQVKGEK